MASGKRSPCSSLLVCSIANPASAVGSAMMVHRPGSPGPVCPNSKSGGGSPTLRAERLIRAVPSGSANPAVAKASPASSHPKVARTVALHFICGTRPADRQTRARSGSARAATSERNLIGETGGGDPSMRNHLDNASVAQRLDGEPSDGESAFPHNQIRQAGARLQPLRSKKSWARDVP